MTQVVRVAFTSGLLETKLESDAAKMESSTECVLIIVQQMKDVKFSGRGDVVENGVWR